MNLALMQAKRALGNTGENPAVGCVIVKNSCVIGAGFTGKKGRPHAEVNAINSSKFNIDNSCLYVTLEPCSHYGKTSPCTKTIKRNKIKKVFFSIKDPDIRSFNKCLKELKKNGISVQTGICASEISKFYNSYLKAKSNALPFVTCKVAISKDYFTIDKRNKWITNKYSRARVQLIRSFHDCIITSSQTIIDDNPMLTCRINGLSRRSPSRIILDNRLRIPLNSKLISNSSRYRTIIFYNKINKRKIKILKRLRIESFKIPLTAKGNFNLHKVLTKLKDLGFSRIFLESGVKLTTSFLSDNLVDDFKLFISGAKLGKNGNGNIKGYFRRFIVNKKSTTEKINLFGEKLKSYKIK